MTPDEHRAHDAIGAAWSRASSPDEFRARLQERGFILARDERDNLHAVDVLERNGQAHPLNERTLPGPAENTRARLRGIDRDQVPTVERVERGREHVHEQRAGVGRAVGREAEGVIRELGQEAANILGGAGGPSKSEQKPEPYKAQRPPDRERDRGRGFGR